MAGGGARILLVAHDFIILFHFPRELNNLHHRFDRFSTLAASSRKTIDNHKARRRGVGQTLCGAKLETRHLTWRWPRAYVTIAPARTLVTTVSRTAVLIHISIMCIASTILLHVQAQHHRRPSLEELKAQGIYRTPEQTEADERQHKVAAAVLQQELEHR